MESLTRRKNTFEKKGSCPGFAGSQANPVFTYPGLLSYPDRFSHRVNQTPD